MQRCEHVAASSSRPLQLRALPPDSILCWSLPLVLATAIALIRLGMLVGAGLPLPSYLGLLALPLNVKNKRKNQE
jgi:hypothetical protein